MSSCEDERVLEVKSPAVRGVERFMSRMWMHPLVDLETRMFRQFWRTELLKLTYSGGLEEKRDFIFLPAGSFLWAPSVDESDYDILGSFVSYQAACDFEAIRYKEDKDDKVNFVFPPNYQFGLESVGDRFSKAILFTPDEFILGNTDFAKNIRTSILNDILYEGIDCWNAFEEYFRLHYLSWGFNDKDYNNEKRVDRFNDRLERRSAISRDPDKYKERFMHARENFGIPSFEAYYQALKETSGHLNMSSEILSSFRSRGDFFVYENILRWG